jgi:hypothetical protein
VLRFIFFRFFHCILDDNSSTIDEDSNDVQPDQDEEDEENEEEEEEEEEE